MSRAVPQPVLSLVIFGVWLGLASAPGWGSVVLAAVLGLAVPLVTPRFAPPLRRPGLAVLLAARVLLDIVAANLTVARQVLGPVARLRPAFFEVPTTIADPFVASLLGGIISLTPGTVTIEVELDGGKPVRLRVHGLDVPDKAAAIAAIRARYEVPLKAVFAC